MSISLYLTAMINLHRLQDRLSQWWRYSQPSQLQQELLGQYTDVIDTEVTLARLASEDAARYVLEHMRTVRNFKTDYDLHRWVCQHELDPGLDQGLVLEFGVYSGRTINQLSKWLAPAQVWGFDSFEGLPEDWTSRMPQGFFARKDLPRVRPNVKLVKGWFDQTLPRFLSTTEKPVRLLHIDSDLYSSAQTVLTQLSDRLRLGTVIIFDEYMNYPGWQQDEFRAWQELVQARQISYRYIGRVSRHQQVAVRIDSIKN
jgi:hypothetical protein